MVITNLGSRSDIKKSLKEAFDAVESGDYTLAIKVFDNLRFSVRTYHVTRGKPFQKFDDLFEDAAFTLRVATNNHFKKELMEEHLVQITEAIRGAVPSDPYEHLKEIMEEIRFCLGALAEDKDAASNIIDLFDEISNLKDNFNDNIYFPMMTQYMGDVIPLLIQVSKIERPPGALVVKLTDKFSAFSVAAQRVLVPPVKLNISREQIIQNIQAGIPIRDIADGIGITEKELREMIEGKNVSEDEKEDSSK